MRDFSSQLSGVKTVAIAGHVRPDGDCTGSCLATYNYLKNCYPEIDVTLYLEPIPNIFKFLAGSGEIVHDCEEVKTYDLFIAQDINEKNTKGLPNAFALKKMLRKESICIIIPNTYGMNLYFPQCEKGKFGHALKEHFKAFQISADEKKGKELWHKLDWMNEISDANIDLHGKGECILDINTYSSKDIVSNVEKEILKLEEREKLCGKREDIYDHRQGDCRGSEGRGVGSQ